MQIRQSFILATKSLMASKLRAILTMLGMIIGVASVIIIVGLGNGVTTYIEDIFNSMGANVISSMVLYQGNNIELKDKEIQEFVDNTPSVNAYSPYITAGMANVKYETEEHTSSIIGGNEQYALTRDRGIIEGRFLQYIDIERIQKVCVIGTFVRDELFDKSEKVIGSKIKINGQLYTIVGVLESKQEGVEGGEDDIVIIPHTVVQRQFKLPKIANYLFTYANPEDADMAEEAIDNFFYKKYGDTDDYMIINAKTILEQLNSILGTLTTFLVAIAGISLLVGGIGIMNIMLISVTERTKEIGIRKALGAKKKDILTQFVIEAITTSIIGGTIGIIFGISVSFLIAPIINLTPTISITSIIVATSVSGFVGVIFGYLPAKKAANLHPIDALRYE